jgi:mono/diheme cytochrome c family protein
MKIILAIVAVIVVIAAAGLAFIYSGMYDVSALKPEGKLRSWLFSTVMDNSVEHYSKDIKAPDLSDTSLVMAGFQRYSRMCIGCHGAPGIKPGGMVKGFNPEPPDLVEGVADQSDAEIFWIIKNGIKMTGMPAYGISFPDSTLWEVTAFVRLLPKMTAEQYQGYNSTNGQQGEERERRE